MHFITYVSLALPLDSVSFMITWLLGLAQSVLHQMGQHWKRRVWGSKRKSFRLFMLWPEQSGREKTGEQMSGQPSTLSGAPYIAGLRTQYLICCNQNSNLYFSSSQYARPAGLKPITFISLVIVPSECMIGSNDAQYGLVAREDSLASYGSLKSPSLRCQTADTPWGYWKMYKKKCADCPEF